MQAVANALETETAEALEIAEPRTCAPLFGSPPVFIKSFVVLFTMPGSIPPPEMFEGRPLMKFVSAGCKFAA